MTRWRRLAQILASAQIALGLLIVAGNLLPTLFPVTARILGGLDNMLPGAALCFILQGAALLFSLRAAPQASRIATALAVVQLVLALFAVMQSGLGVSLGTHLPGVQDGIASLERRTGQLPFSAAFAFVAAALVTILLRFRAREWTSDLAHVLIGVVFLAGLFAAIGSLLRFDLIYSWYSYTRMAVDTALAMMTVAISQHIAWQEGLPVPDRERNTATLGTAALIVVPLLSGAVGIGVLKIYGEDALAHSLKMAHQARVDALLTMIEQYSARAAIMTTRPNLTKQLRIYENNRENGDAREATKTMVRSFLPHGFSSIEMNTLDGRHLVVAGEPIEKPSLEVPIHVDGPGQITLLWANGLVLRVRDRIRDASGEFAEVVTEQPLIDRRGTVFSASQVGSSADLLLCGPGRAGPACFPNHPGQQPFGLALSGDGAQMPAALAFRGEAGSVTFHEPGGSMGIAVYGPIGGTGLASAIKIDAAEFYGPIGRGLLWGFLLVTVVTAAGVVLLRGTIRLLLRRLALAEQHYRHVVESLHEGVMLQDAQGRVIASNRAASRILDDSAEAIRNYAPADFGIAAVHEDGSEWRSADHPVTRTLRTGQPEAGVVMGLRRRDGRLQWISVNTVPTAGLAAGDTHGVVMSFDDITERRQAEARERQLDQRFRLLVEGVSDYGIIMLGVGGTIASWNPGAERIQGYGTAEIVGRHFAVFYPHAEIRSGKPTDDLAAAARLGRFEEEGWRLRKDGSRFWANILITAVNDGAGTLIGFSHIARDLSERRMAEQELAQAYQFQAAILEGAPFSIIATDPDGTIRSMNPAAERMLGYANAELVGLARLDVLHDNREIAEGVARLTAELDMVIEQRCEVLLARARYGGTEEREWLYVRKDGTRLPVSLSVAALRDENEAITGFLGIAYDITERKRRDEMVQHVAHHDFLTGLPNRALLNDRLAVALELARREKRKLAVLMLDLDHFKRVNDSLGHHIGDELLILVAQRVLSCVRSTDTVARMGGDEFVIVLGSVDETAGIERVAKVIVERIAAPMMIGNQELMVTPSIGIACFPDDGENGDTLLRNADTAMYLAKSAGRHGYRVFNRDMELAARAKLDLEVALRRALKQEEFELLYQPQVSLDTGDTIGIEALLRWDDPKRGRVSPDDFVQVAEDNGLILPIGEWVLRRACRDAATMRRRIGRELKLAVNLSSRQFRQDNLVALIEAALAESGLPPAALELEITESVIMAQTDETLDRLRRIRALGVSIAVDDFGVGFSSLSYITRFPIDTLKVDRAFVSRLPDSASDAAVAQAIIALAHSLGIKIVAEGVESRGQLAFLYARRGGYADGGASTEPLSSASGFSVQGYLFCEPVSCEHFIDRFEHIVRTGHHHIFELRR